MFAGYPDWFPRRHDDPAPAAARPPAGDVERIAAVFRARWRARRALDAREQHPALALKPRRLCPRLSSAVPRMRRLKDVTPDDDRNQENDHAADHAGQQ